jgi:hypothetical protein
MHDGIYPSIVLLNLLPEVDGYRKLMPRSSEQPTEQVIYVAKSLPIKDGRRTTDLLFCFLLFISWAVMTCIGLSALGIPYFGNSLIKIKAGNPQLLLHGVDYQGNICGISSTVSDAKYTWNPNIAGTNADNNGKYAPPFLSVCVSRCPHEGDEITDIYGTYGTWKSQYDSTAPLYNCISKSFSSQYTDSADTTVLIFRSFIESAATVGVSGFVLASIVSLLYLFIIRIPLVLRMAVWLCIYLILGILVAGGYSLLTRARFISRSCTSADNECKVEV